VPWLKANADHSWLSCILQFLKLWTKLLFLIDDRRAGLTLQLSMFCDTAYLAAFAIRTSIKPFCF